MENLAPLIKDLPDPDGTARFVDELNRRHPAKAAKIMKDAGLLSDVLTLAAHSPLLASTMLQHPEYIAWLDKCRLDPGVRSKDELLESLGRFAMTNSMLEPHVLLSRFRRRELMRIYLQDIRRLVAIAEITEEISGLADTILEYALNLARQEMNNRYGMPQFADEKGRMSPAEICVVSLGKLGSRELNYSSDIDLLYVYEADGQTTGMGSRGQVTNREYFVKLAETVNKLVGEQTGEGAAYRVDMRLRPHGRSGPLAASLADTANYYLTEAQAWERQVMIRSRASAGERSIYKELQERIKDTIFSIDETVENALASVRRSKEKIDAELNSSSGYNVKLGRGGIREIEFLSQALQLAYGGSDKWLRVPHTLQSLLRLADRRHITESELTKLYNAYTFLRRLEHVLQMENGLQTHIVSSDENKRLVAARRMDFATLKGFDNALNRHTVNVSKIFKRIFADSYKATKSQRGIAEKLPQKLKSSIEKDDSFEPTTTVVDNADDLVKVSQRFTDMLAANPHLVSILPDSDAVYTSRDYRGELFDAIAEADSFADDLSALRKKWAAFLLEIVEYDARGKLSLTEVKRLQTQIAEASIAAALKITEKKLSANFGCEVRDVPISIFGLGKLGGAGIDYDSDLDLLLINDGEFDSSFAGVSRSEFYADLVDVFTNVLSGMTRDGSLYRIDLRLRPYGSSGKTTISRDALLKYIEKESAIWELLAFVKIRAVGGNADASPLEQEIRAAIHQRAKTFSPGELKAETAEIRSRLEKTKGPRRSDEINIKFGSGGMLDIYFAIRFLQLRDDVPDDVADRSTGFMLKRLSESGSLSGENFADLSAGYEFLSMLDHQLRLTVGRTTKLPPMNNAAMQITAKRMGFETAAAMVNELNLHRHSIRQAFLNTLEPI